MARTAARSTRETKTSKAKSVTASARSGSSARVSKKAAIKESARAGAVERGLTAFGERLVLTLQSKGMSDSELADALGIAQPNIHTLKYKTDRPRFKTVAKIAKVLGVEPEILLPQTMSAGSHTLQDSTKVYLVIESPAGRQTIRLA